MKLPTKKASEFLAILFISIAMMSLLLVRFDEVWKDAALFTVLCSISLWFSHVKENNIILIIITFIFIAPKVLIAGAIKGLSKAFQSAKRDIIE